MAQVKDLLVKGQAKFLRKAYFQDQIVSNVAQGTAPLVVASSTVVSNLNSDYLNGYHASGLFTALSANSTLSITIGGTTLTSSINAATVDGKYISNYYTKSEADDRFVNVTGDTMSGHLTIKTASYKDQLTIYRNENNNNSVINFSNKDGFLGAIGFTGLGQPGMAEKPHIVLKDSSLHVLLHDGNYTDYTVTKTGTGASGTWGISISGNATTASYASVLTPISKPTTDTSAYGNPFSYFVGQQIIGTADGNAYAGSSNDYNLLSFPTEGTVHNDYANIMTLRLSWDKSKYWHDIFASPNEQFLWHRNVYNGTAYDWCRIVEETTNRVWGINISGKANIANNLLFIENIPANTRGELSRDYRLYTGIWSKKDLGYASQYGQFIDLSGGTTWYHRLAFNTTGVIEHFQGINTTTLTKVGDLAYTSSNVASASKWETPRTITLTGSVTGSVSIDGSQNVTLDTTTNHTHNYLPLSGGTLSGYLTIKNPSSDVPSPLIIDTNSTVEVGQYFRMSGTNKGWIGYHPNSGMYLYTYNGPHMLGIKDDGTGYIDSNTILHSGNYNSYAPKLDGTGATGTWGINISGNAATATNADTLDGFHESSFSRHVEGVVFAVNTTRYYKLGNLPQSSTSTYDAFLIQGGIGGFTSSQKAVLNVSVGRREGVIFCGYTQGLWHRNLGIEIGINDAGEIVLIVTGSWCAWTLDLHTIQGTISYTGTTFTPTDTNFVLLSASNNVSKSLADGTVEKATKLATPRTITLTGSVTGSVSIDGSQNVSLVTTTNHTHNYLPLSGGTMTGDIATKSFKSGTDSLGLYIEAKSNVGARIQYNKSTTGMDYDTLLLKNGDISWNNNPVLHSGNYNSYAPKLDGTGATGTWGINITGSAGSATFAYVLKRNTGGIRANDRGPAPDTDALYTGGWASSSLGYATTYGTFIDLSGYSTWYHRLAFNTNGVIEHFMGINTTTLSKVGNLAYTSDIPTSLPANGGNADTVDSKHASDFAPAGHTHDERYQVISSTTASGITSLATGSYSSIHISTGSGGTMSFSSTPASGKECHIVIYNSGSSNITITLPSGYRRNIDSITIASGAFGEVNVLNAAGPIYVRAV